MGSQIAVMVKKCFLKNLKKNKKKKKKPVGMDRGKIGEIARAHAIYNLYVYVFFLATCFFLPEI